MLNSPRRGLVLAAAALLIVPAACQPSPPEKARSALESPESRMRYLALGDSYTIGEGVAAGSRWPSLLAAEVEAAGCGRLKVTVVARTGWNTDELMSALARERLDPPYDLVTLLIGVNDQYRGRGLDDFAVGFGRALSESIRLAGGAPGRVVVLSIPDWAVTPFGKGAGASRVSQEIDDFNAVVAAAARAAGVRFVDVTAQSRLAAAQEGLLAPDGLHYSEAMYRRWAGSARPEACAALGRSVP